MMTFAAGLIVGLALGLVTVGFLAIAAYERGIAEATGQRQRWRAELVARRVAARAAASRVGSAPAPQPVMAASAPAPAPVPQVAAITTVARKAS